MTRARGIAVAPTWRLALTAALSAWVLACSEATRRVESLSPLPPDRHEYQAFRGAHPGIREPNYLPFLVHRLRMDGAEGELLVTCRFPDERFPLAVGIDAPEIDDALADDATPTQASVYVEAVEKALGRWERELGPPVRFRRAAPDETPDVRVRLVGQVAPVPEDGKRVLGMTPLGDACQVRGGDPSTGRIDATLEHPEVRIFVADEFGLLTPDQVETVAAHEIGHALGARSHSPLPADLMHEVARDRLGARRLSTEDVNSFAALYALPSGTVYAQRGAADAASQVAPAPAPGPPRLAEKAWDGAAHGFSVRLPEGWTAIPVDHGVAAVDGFAWDYEASLQILGIAVDGIEGYLTEYGPAHFAKGPLLGRRDLRIADRRALRFAVGVEESDTVEEITLIEAGKGRLLLVIAEAPADAYEAYGPWLQKPLESLVVEEPRREGKSSR